MALKGVKWDLHYRTKKALPLCDVTMFNMRAMHLKECKRVGGLFKPVLRFFKRF